MVGSNGYQRSIAYKARMGQRNKALQAENKRLRESLELIAPPNYEGRIWTDKCYQNEEHERRMLKYINDRQPEGTTVLAGTFYQLVTDVAETALKE